MISDSGVEAEILIDKVVARWCFGSQPHGNSEYEALHSFKYSSANGEFPKKGSYWAGGKSPFTHLSQPLSGAGELHIKFGYVHGRHWAWYGFNPSKLVAEEWEELSVYFNLLFSHGFSDVWANARLAKYDIAIDLHGAKFTDYAFIDRRLRAGDGTLQEIGSSYLGSEHGARSLICYDKSKEIKDKGAADPYGDRLRLEARISNPGKFALSDIGSIQNPFSNLAVIDRSSLAKNGGKLITDFSEEIGAGYPADFAFFNRPKEERESLWADLQALQPPWWSPQEIWSGYGNLLGWPDNLTS